MKCPVPGCPNTALSPGQPFCPYCGIIKNSYQFCFDFVNNYWRPLESDPIGYVKYWRDRAPRDSRFRRRLEEMLLLAERRVTYRMMFEFEGQAVPHDINLDEVYDPLRGQMVFLRSPLSFRVAHFSQFAFFRCWFCDLEAFAGSSEDRGPLLPPTLYAHSTMADKFMGDLRDDYTLHEKYKAERDRVKAIIIPEPQEVRKHTGSLQGLGFSGPMDAHYQQQMADWARAAAQQDQSETAQRRQDYYRALDAKKQRIAELERLMEQHPKRPDARNHKPCPHCGMKFPYILRDFYGENPFMKRDETNYNEPLYGLEWDLSGFTEEFHVFHSNKDTKESRWIANWACELFYSIYHTKGILALPPLLWLAEGCAQEGVPFIIDELIEKADQLMS
jgi:hypothetical protein